MDGSYDRFIWRQPIPGVWQRDIDEAEQFYASMAKLYEGSGRMFFAITGHVSLCIEVAGGQAQEAAERRVEESLRQAWLRLRSEQPAIASQVVHDSSGGTARWKKVYREVGREDEQRAWLTSTFEPLCTAKTGNEWCNSDPPAPRWPTVFLLSQPDRPPGLVRREVVFRSPHDIIDGMGTLHLLNRLVALAASQYQELSPTQPGMPFLLDGSEVARLPPPYRVAANVPSRPTPAHQELLRLLAANSDHATRAEPRHGEPVRILAMPYKKGALLPGRHQRLVRTLTPQQTSRLLAACTVLGVTVTHAFHAAIAMALRDVQDRGDETVPVQYQGYILRNEREVCACPYNTPSYAAAVYHSVSGDRLFVDMTTRTSDEADQQAMGGLGMGVELQERDVEFLRIVNCMRKHYRRVQQNPHHYALAPYILAASTPAVPANTRPPPLPVPPPRERPSVSLSSMGRIDRVMAARHGVFCVDDPWVTGDELTNGLGVFLGTFQGRLSVSIAYNDAWHGGGGVGEFLQRCEDIVMQGVGLQDWAWPPEGGL